MVRPNVPAVYQQRMIVGSSEKQVLAELRRRAQLGQLHSAGAGVQIITQGPHAGSYAIPVYLRTVPAPRRALMWRKAAGVAAGALLLAGLTGWVLSSLAGLPLAILLIAVLILFVRRVHRTVTVTTTTTTKITVR